MIHPVYGCEGFTRVEGGDEELIVERAGFWVGGSQLEPSFYCSVSARDPREVGSQRVSFGCVCSHRNTSDFNGANLVPPKALGSMCMVEGGPKFTLLLPVGRALPD